MLAERLGHVPDAAEIAGLRPDTLVAVFAKPPALHRFPGSMAKRVQAMCRAVVERYDNDVTKVWTGAADGKDLLKRVAALPGFGAQKAQIFVALLGKQYGVDAPGWREAAGDFGPEGRTSPSPTSATPTPSPASASTRSNSRPPPRPTRKSAPQVGEWGRREVRGTWCGGSTGAGPVPGDGAGMGGAALSELDERPGRC